MNWRRVWEWIFPGSTNSTVNLETEHIEEERDVSLGERLAQLNEAQAEAFRRAARQRGGDRRLHRLADHAETEAELYRLYGLEAEAFDVLVEDDNQ